MTILHYIFIALEVLLVFNLIIGVHELGHFLAAKWRGLKIERFAIWFGPAIWKKKIGDVEYCLNSIPFGGYVALPQMASMEGIEGKTQGSSHLPPVSPLDKIIVAFAGPLFSILLAFVFAFLVWGVGKPGDSASDSAVVGWVDPSGPAGLAGLHAGDMILEVDGHPVKSFMPTGDLNESIKWRIITGTGTNVAIKYERDGVATTAYIIPTNPPTKWYERRALRQISIAPAENFSIGDIANNSPAALAGLKGGDEILALDGQKVFSPAAYFFVESALTNKPNTPVTFTVKRGDEQFTRTLLAVKPITPTNAEPSFGIVSLQGETNIILLHPNPLEQVEASATQIFSTIGALFERGGQVGVQQLGGAVMIGRVYFNLMQDTDGWRRVLWFSVVLNVNLALINMLPLPVLDGGHILLSLIEMIRRRPIGPRLLNSIQSAFMVLLIGFMLYIAFFDTGDWIRSAHADRDVPVIFAPANVAPVDHGVQVTIPPVK